jgi:hypothetical protein
MTEEKFISPFPQPTGLIAELLVCLNEELTEVGQRICKAQRFGLDEVQKDQPYTNEQRIMLEMADLLAVLEMLQEHNVLVVDKKQFDFLKKEKCKKLKKYLQSLNNLNK